MQPVRRHARRPLRHREGRARRRVLYVLGLVTMAHATTPLALVLSCGVLIGTGLSGLTFSVDLRRARPRVSARKAQHGARHLGRGGIVRPVRDAAADAGGCISHLGWYGALLALAAIALLMGPLAVALVEKRADDDARVPAVRRRRRCARRSASRLHAADGRLFRLRLPGRVRRRAPARLSRGQGHAAARRRDGAGADRPLQHRRHLRDRLARLADAASATSCRRSISAAAS